MASKKIAQKDNKTDNKTGKEKMLIDIKGKLTTSLEGLKEQLGEKKFEKRISKAAEKLVKGIKITTTKKVNVVKKKIAGTKS